MELIQHFLTLNPCYVNNVNKADKRYINFQKNGPKGGMLHSVGCAQPDATVFLNGWNKSTYYHSCVHGVIDANNGIAYQCLPWNFRGWHGASGPNGSCNDFMIGVEMCESKYIRYLVPGDSGYSPGKFSVLDKTKAQTDCKRAYNTAVKLFAMLANTYHWNVNTDICSHKEGYSRGIASSHGDPEHYWKGLGMSYTMDKFRSDVIKEVNNLNSIIYRVRKTWSDHSSQIGAYRNFETAKKNCPVGYSVFDEDGNVVYVNKDEVEINMTKEELNELIDSRAKEQAKKYFNEYLKSLKTNSAGSWSKSFRQWAIDNGLITGIGNLPDGTPNYAWGSFVTREQLVTFLGRYDKISTPTTARLVDDKFPTQVGEIVKVICTPDDKLSGVKKGDYLISSNGPVATVISNKEVEGINEIRAKVIGSLLI